MGDQAGGLNSLKARPARRVGAAGVAWPTARAGWSLLALALALAAQQSLEPRDGRSWIPGLLLYLLAVAALIQALRRGEVDLAPLPADELPGEYLALRRVRLAVSAGLALVAFAAFSGDLFTPFNVTLWVAALGLLISALWIPAADHKPVWRRGWSWRVSRWGVLCLAAGALAVFFRVYQLGSVPGEMFSDHAEKLLDVAGVLHGKTLIFFPRNTGREALQMYLTAAVSLMTGTGLSFIALKIGSVLAGLGALPFLYLLGKEMGSRRAGLWAVVLAGMAYWPNVISRVGLRFPLAPLFWAPTFYYLVRGLRTGNRNHFLISGLCLGLGLHGYSPFRMAPLVVLFAVLLYLGHQASRQARRRAVAGLVALAAVSLVLFLPLLRYGIEHPNAVAYRALTRLGTAERPLPGPASKIFFGNLANAMAMFFWDDGEIWVDSVVHRPALDVVSGALFILGVALLGIRYLRRRHWLDLFVLLSIPLLMMPSILSLAFPRENPTLNRAGMALVPVFLIAGLALDAFLTAVRSRLGGRPAVALAAALVFWAAFSNYDLVIHQYRLAYELKSWNTSEMGRVVRSFADSVGSAETSWLVAYPHWADGRLVAMNAGYPLLDCSLPHERFADTARDPRAKLFLLHPNDTDGLKALHGLYPLGVVRRYRSRIRTKDFLAFLIPPQAAAVPMTCWEGVPCRLAVPSSQESHGWIRLWLSMAGLRTPSARLRSTTARTLPPRWSEDIGVGMIAGELPQNLIRVSDPKRLKSLPVVEYAGSEPSR